MFARQSFAKLLLADPLGTCQLSLKALKQPDRRISREDAREADIATGDLDMHPVVAPFGCGRLVDVQGGSEWHVSSEGFLNASSGCLLGRTESVASVAALSPFANIGIPGRCA